MYTWENSHEFWRLPSGEQQRLFNTPCNDNWECPKCGELYRYHSGAPMSGLYSCFLDFDGNRLWLSSGCCKEEYSNHCFPREWRIS